MTILLQATKVSNTATFYLTFIACLDLSLTYCDYLNVSDSRAFPCGHCNVSFTLLINLVNHKLQVHPHLIQFLCRSCGLETHDRNLFNKHVSPNFVAAFDCSCGEQFKTAA